MSFTTKECAWAQTSVKVLGATINGIRGFSFKKDIEKEHLYAAGDEPIDIQTGNKKPEGSLTILKYEFDKLNDAAQLAGYSDISEVPHPLILITCSFKKLPTDPIRIVEAQGVAFTGFDVAMQQNAKMGEIALPFLCMKIQLRKGA